MSSTDTLAAIAERLDAGTDPAQVIGALLPATRAEAVVWARRLSGWDMYRDRYPGRAVAVARLVSRRAMKEHDLVLTEDGRVIGRSTPRGSWVHPPAPEVFPLLDGEVRVEYTPGDCTDPNHGPVRSPKGTPEPHRAKTPMRAERVHCRAACSDGSERFRSRPSVPWVRCHPRGPNRGD